MRLATSFSFPAVEHTQAPACATAAVGSVQKALKPTGDARARNIGLPSHTLIPSLREACTPSRALHRGRRRAVLRETHMRRIVGCLPALGQAVTTRVHAGPRRLAAERCGKTR